MDARRMRRGRAGSHDRECPTIIGEERVSVWQAIIEILVLHVCMTDRDGALFAKLEAGVRRNVETLRAVVRSNSRAVVLAGVGARDVEPVSDDIDWLTKVNSHSCVVGHVEAIGERLSAGDPWTKLNDRRSATR